MTKFAVTLTKTQFLTVIILADTEQDAEDIALDQLYDGEYDKAPWLHGDIEVSNIETAEDK